MEICAQYPELTAVETGDAMSRKAPAAGSPAPRATSLLEK